MVKLTFTLDETTVAELDEAAKRKSIPKSQAVREAIHDYHAKSDRLSEAERQRMLRVMRRIMASPPTRPQEEVERELRELRASRRRGWQRPADSA